MNVTQDEENSTQKEGNIEENDEEESNSPSQNVNQSPSAELGGQSERDVNEVTHSEVVNQIEENGKFKLKRIMALILFGTS